MNMISWLDFCLPFNASFSKELDDQIQALIRNGTRMERTDGTMAIVKFGPFYLWIGNYPYAYGTRCIMVPGKYILHWDRESDESKRLDNYRPSRKTIRQLHALELELKKWEELKDIYGTDSNKVG